MKISPDRSLMVALWTRVYRSRQGPNSVTKELELMESQLYLEYQHDAADRMGAATTIRTAAERCARVRESTDSERLRQASGGHRIRTGRGGPSS